MGPVTTNSDGVGTADAVPVHAAPLATRLRVVLPALLDAEGRPSPAAGARPGGSAMTC